MKTFKWLAVFGLFISTPAFAQVAPSFTQGSMNSTTTTSRRLLKRLQLKSTAELITAIQVTMSLRVPKSEVQAQPIR